MKNIIRLFLFVAVLFIPAIAFAQGSGSYEQPPPRSTGNEANREESNFAATRSTTGGIVGIKDGILTVKTDKDKEVSVILVKETKFKIGKKTIHVKELDEKFFKEGRKVKIIYQPFRGKKTDIDKVALEVRFEEDKTPKEKPKIG